MSSRAKTISKKHSATPAGNLDRSTHTEYYVYIARCSDSTLYTGYTTDPVRRMLEHNSGVGSHYTRSRLPVQLSYLKRVPSRREALRMEASIKRMNKRKKLLLCEKYTRGEKLS